jgi:ATP-dependent DNA helicase RecQ
LHFHLEAISLQLSAQYTHKDVVLSLPTGAGKGVCFQVPAIVACKLRKQITVVVCPLKALMADQVDKLRRRGIPAEMFGAADKDADVLQWLRVTSTDDIDNSAYTQHSSMVYMSAEKLVNAVLPYINTGKVSPLLASLFDLSSRNQIFRFVFDEAHYHANLLAGFFRKSSVVLHAVRRLFPGVPFSLVSATISRDATLALCGILHLRQPVSIIQVEPRTNFVYSVVTLDTKQKASSDRILNFCCWFVEYYKKFWQPEGGKAASVIIYARKIRECEQVSETLVMNGITSTTYHGKLKVGAQKTNMIAWREDKAAVMVATSAFSMGVDKADVRCVVPLDFPSGMTDVVQEGGRAGRDGMPAHSILVRHGSSQATAKSLSRV